MYGTQRTETRVAYRSRSNSDICTEGDIKNFTNTRFNNVQQEQLLLVIFISRKEIAINLSLVNFEWNFTFL